MKDKAEDAVAGAEGGVDPAMWNCVFLNRLSLKARMQWLQQQHDCAFLAADACGCAHLFVANGRAVECPGHSDSHRHSYTAPAVQPLILPWYRQQPAGPARFNWRDLYLAST